MSLLVSSSSLISIVCCGRRLHFCGRWWQCGFWARSHSSLRAASLICHQRQGLINWTTSDHSSNWIRSQSITINNNNTIPFCGKWFKIWHLGRYHRRWPRVDCYGRSCQLKGDWSLLYSNSGRMNFTDSQTDTRVRVLIMPSDVFHIVAHAEWKQRSTMRKKQMEFLFD